ncbi:vitamin B12-dependent ribonucleotide reductase [Desulfovibrio litoralis]|uniref:Vitamin B12-dependent ribonucleotide reductase n=1 Tax=Desulfovibrio litoralis DSM 11393 TaxID=1121455 RepID=A0A1M7TIZ7_9BACT|nr:vitamin B12-dependent ribonucleotide reductase [Desulfovibrio litoralis]SHN70690.1 ribonucleoside-diphosphate reductase class II [Desulfovibrio litoralis DSM 11393]
MAHIHKDMLKKPAKLPSVTLNPNAKLVLEKRYFRRNLDGEYIENAEDLFWRVASSVAKEETKYPKSPYKADDLALEFYNLMTSWRFLPNSPTLMNAGTELGQLSACFVLPVGDSIEEIFDAVKHAAMIHKSGGGTGFSFSRVRPKDSRVGSTGGVASGPLSFLKIFNTATEQIKQGGTRRGANMGILRVDHPDIIEFIKAKEREGEFNNFNLSIGLTEKFMKAVEKDEEYPLINPHSKETVGKLRAKEIFELLVRKAWESGDPGIVFLDRINRDNPTPAQGEMESTNPCGEQPLLPYEACNLGSINLAKFFVPNKENGEAINWEDLKRTIALAVRFLDNVIDASRFPLPLITENVRKNRKIGLGIMGFADLLYQMRIPYDSQAAMTLAGKIMQFIRNEGRAASLTLAKERGAFPAYEESVFPAKGEGPFRNATITTIAPTGTLSIIAGCSSGIEPLFALSFSRNVMDGERLVEANIYFEEALKQENAYSKKLMELVAEKGSIAEMEQISPELRNVFVTAMDIDGESHLKMQAAFQEFTDNAVSKTVNLPHEATIDDIRNIYSMAYEHGCKGVTVYRDGCKSVQVLCTGSSENQKPEEANTRIVKERPDVVFGFTQKVHTGMGVMYVTINEVDGKPFELFTTIGKSGRSITAKAEAIGRLVSLALRSGISVLEIVRQIKGIGGEHPVFQKKGLLLSIPDAIASVLEAKYLQGTKTSSGGGYDLMKQHCPDCDEVLVFQEGCHICPKCAFSRCG